MIPALFVRLCDDAAVFPPGRMPLRDAVVDLGLLRVGDGVPR
ncbi:hypothetical protein ABN034_26315 [Actinopolymorpha sp. B11F2]